MCWWCADDNKDPADSGPTGAVKSCDHSGSEILLMDELGDALGGLDVECDFGAGWVKATTGGDGRICLSAGPGTKVKVKVADGHEMKAGDGVKTASGKHIALGGTAP